MDDAWADALEESKNAEGGAAKNSEGQDWDTLTPQDNNDNNGTATGAVNFDELGDVPEGQAGIQNLDFLLDIPLQLSVELGRTSLIIDKMLQLAQGSVVELEKTAGEPVDIYVNRKLLGKGEVIVVNDRFGVRITEIISQSDRIKNMA